MIVGSILLILVAVGLLVGGVLGGSNALIICCIIVVVLAAVVLVLGVKQSAASGAAFGIDIDGEADETSEYPAVPGRAGRVRPDHRVIDETPALGSSSRYGAGAASAGSAVTADHGRMNVDEEVVRTIPSQGTPGHSSASRVTAAPYGDASPGRRSHAAPDDDDPYEPPIQSFNDPAYETLRDDPADSMTVTDVIDARDVAALDVVAGHLEAGNVEARDFEARDFEARDYAARHIEILDVDVRDVEARDFEVRDFEALDFGARDAGAPDIDSEFDEDPPDEPSIQMVSPANAARVAMLSADVLVVDGRPRYHVSGCVHLHGRETEPLPVGEAVELGFTPCALCEPDSALLADARRV